MKSPFEILGIDPDADESEIVAAYRQRIKTAHPDQGGSVEEFQLVRTAYKALQDGQWATEDGLERARVDEDQSQPTTTSVQYLNYEVLDDKGWALDDEDLFAKASADGLDPRDYGQLEFQFHNCLLNAAESSGFEWPYACRGGACANCAVAVVEGDLDMPAGHILPQEMLDRGIRLSCIGVPTTDELKVVYNIKHLPGLDELRLPPQQAKYLR